MEYLYPPLVDITNKPKEEVIEYCRIKTAEKIFEAKEITKQEKDDRIYRAKNKIQEPIMVVAIQEEVKDEEETEEQKKKKEDKLK